MPIFYPITMLNNEHKKIKIIYKIYLFLNANFNTFHAVLKKFITAKAVFVLRLEKMNYVTAPENPS